MSTRTRPSSCWATLSRLLQNVSFSSHYKTDGKTDHVAAYLQQEEVKYSSSSSEWLIASVILAVFMVLLVLWLLFLMYKQYWVREAS